MIVLGLRPGVVFARSTDVSRAMSSFMSLEDSLGPAVLTALADVLDDKVI